MRQTIRRSDRGITLIELVVVMVIIAMFATLVGSRVFRSVERGKQTVAKAQIQEFETNLDMFRLDVGRYPTTEEGLLALQSRPEGLSGWDGPYLKKQVPLDPWGNPYIYRRPGQQAAEFDLVAMGPDGREGGDGNDHDITN